jgi:hypothetical protein
MRGYTAEIKLAALAGIEIAQFLRTVTLIINAKESEGSISGNLSGHEARALRARRRTKMRVHAYGGREILS